MLLEMKVFGLALDPLTNAPIIILKDSNDKNVLPIWIGPLEASAIATELEKIHLARPMTHDLLKEILKSLDITDPKIEITNLEDNVYYAVIHLVSGYEMDNCIIDIVFKIGYLNLRVSYIQAFQYFF